MDTTVIFLGLMFALAIKSLGQKIAIPDEERQGKYWEKEGQKYLHASLQLPKIQTVAKNVIFFLGDGMGISTVTASRIYKGQLMNKGGEDELLVFDQFPFVSLSKTYGIDRQTSDSANTATAYLCGTKANYGTLGLDGRAQYDNCSSSLDPSTHVHSILKWAQEKGKWTGFVTTTRVTHATPAGLYAHSASRGWEGESPDPACKDIAYQLVHELPGKDIRVIMGGGTKNFINETDKDEHGESGRRKDGKNLIREWIEDKKSKGATARVAFNHEDLKTLNPDDTDYLLGLFSNDHMPYVSDIQGLEKKYPSLAEMTETAMKILSRNPEGYFLLVEGGRIDMGHHDNYAQKALAEGVEFDKAIGSAVSFTNEEDTLIVVTADHSHTFTLGGDYPLRGSNILGIGGVSDVDNKTYTTLGYYNGPGYREDGRKDNLTQEEVLQKDFRVETAVPASYESHGGEDVPVYARGPMAHLFHGVHDQSYIPYVMGYAACIGPNQQHCNSARSLFMTNYWVALFKLLSITLMSYICSAKYFI